MPAARKRTLYWTAGLLLAVAVAWSVGATLAILPPSPPGETGTSPRHRPETATTAMASAGDSFGR